MGQLMTSESHKATCTPFFLQEEALWWEKEFYSEHLICFPDKSAKEPDYIQHKVEVDKCLTPRSIDDKRQGVYLSKKVPLLVDLCMDKVLSVCTDPDVLKDSLPPGLTPLFKRHQTRLNLEKIKLKWLLNELLNKEKSLGARLVSYRKRSTLIVGDTISERFVRDGRPVWMTDLVARQHHLYGYHSPVFRPEPEWFMYLPTAVEGMDSSDWTIAALAHTIHLMLPQRVSLNRSNSLSGSTDTLSNTLLRALETSINRVKYALLKVSPKLVHYCFDPALAYVFWARGNLPQAESLFQRISNEIPCDSESHLQVFNEDGSFERSRPREASRHLFTSQKVMYLNEIARLKLYSDQPTEACKYFEAAFHYSTNCVPDSTPDLRLQTLVLQAEAYDQGLMSDLQAAKALDLWNTVNSQPVSNHKLVQMAAESLLHCHGGYLTIYTASIIPNRNSAWLLESRALLKTLAQKAPNVHLHLSLILALCGDDGAAEDAYMNYVQQYASLQPSLSNKIPGAVSVFIAAEIKPHPWWVLSNWKSNKAGKQPGTMENLEVLPLLWRRKFKHSRCEEFKQNQQTVYRSSPITEVQGGNNQCFHITKDGLLAGAFVQNLPPLCTVLIDPYTGSIILPEEYREKDILPFTNYQIINGGVDMTRHKFTFDTFIPGPVLIYDNTKLGVTVSILSWQKTKVVERLHVSRPLEEETVGTEVRLNYSGPDGDLELNLVDLITQSKKEHILQQLRNNGYDENPLVMEDASDFLDVCILKSFKMQYYFLKTALDGESRERSTLLGIKRSLGKTAAQCANPKQLSENHYKELLNTIEQHGPAVLDSEEIVLQKIVNFGKSTVALAFFTGSSDMPSARGVDVLVFIDCSNVKTFSNPVIQCSPKPDSVWHLLNEDRYETASVAVGQSSTLITLYRTFQRNQLFVFNNLGHVIHVHNAWTNNDTALVPIMSPDAKDDIGMVIITNDSRSRIRLMDTRGIITVQTKPLGQIEKFLVAYNMVFVILRDRIIILDSSNLEPIRVMHNNASSSFEHHSPTKTNPIGVLLTGERSFMKILYGNEFTSTSLCKEYVRVILGVANHVFVLQRAKHDHDTDDPDSMNITPSAPVEVLMTALVPGIPTDACFVSQLAGVVVTASMYENQDLPLYRENLYWFDSSGHLRGMHPFLGKGPHSLFTTQLNDMEITPRGAVEAESEALAQENQIFKKQWHLYFTDGHEAICCIKLVDDLF